MKSDLQKSNRVILHIDGDAFFASCEVALNPKLKGLPVVTGAERGIASSMSYEAKALGVKRGMPIFMVREKFPEVIVVNSDYEAYGVFSERMTNIVKKYTSLVEEYSIDECFADITDIRLSDGKTYADVVWDIKKDIEKELGMIFSFGLGSTKSIAKIGSKFNKPNGFTEIRGKDTEYFLERTPIEKVWGIGPKTSSYLSGLGITTAKKFTEKNEAWVLEKLSKPYYEKWLELNGYIVSEIELPQNHKSKSISDTKTFSPLSKDREFLFSEISRHTENAFTKARRGGYRTKEISVFLKSRDFKYHSLSLKFNKYISSPSEALNVLENRFNEIYRHGMMYRSAGVILENLSTGEVEQFDLFGVIEKSSAVKKIYECLDRLDQKFGRRTVFLGSSLLSSKKNNYKNMRGSPMNIHGKRFGLPFMGEVY